MTIIKNNSKSNINMDYTSLYPTIMKDFNDELIKMEIRLKKLKKIREIIENRNV